MSKYCRRWVYMTVVAQACYDYVTLNTGAGLLIISHKYDNGLKEIYEDIDLPKVDTIALKFLRICSKLNINQNSEHVISDYLYYKFKFVNFALRRILKALLMILDFRNILNTPKQKIL